MTSDLSVVLVAVVLPVVTVCAYFWRAGMQERRAAREAADIREAHILVNGGYHPSRIVLPGRRPLRLNFVRTRDGESWWDDLAFPYAGVRRELPEGGTVTLEVGPLEPGEYALFCGLGSMRGTLVIEDGPAVDDGVEVLRL